MAFGSASGYSNLPNGNFSPVIYSQKVQNPSVILVVEDITNTDYMGEIANFDSFVSRNQKSLFLAIARVLR